MNIIVSGAPIVPDEAIVMLATTERREGCHPPASATSRAAISTAVLRATTLASRPVEGIGVV